MLTSVRTAAMGVLLINLRIEMGANVWSQYPQLRSLPEVSLPAFVAALCAPVGLSREALVVQATQTSDDPDLKELEQDLLQMTMQSCE